MATKAKNTTSAKVAQSKTATNGTAKQERLAVLKTYKMYIGGAFPRTESGRYYTPTNKDGDTLGNICQGSRKDFRNAVQAARKAQGGWAGRAAFNRAQILYRIAEMLEGRKAQFIEELMFQGSTKAQAEKEVFTATDRLIYFAGWCDKYTQIFSSVNPVASPHFNFTSTEATGLVAAMAPESSSLIGLVSIIAPIIAGGNSIVILASESKPLCAVTFAEVLNSSDVPGGVVNILTGSKDELYKQMATHMDVNAVVYCEDNKDVIREIKEDSSLNVKRAHIYNKYNWMDDKAENPYLIRDFQEMKTTWHPIENIGGSGGGY